MTESIYQYYAQLLMEKELIAVPIAPGTKACEEKGWQKLITHHGWKEKVEVWTGIKADYGVGVLLGTPIGPDHVLGCIDVDHDGYVDAVQVSLNGVLCRKKGKKGMSFFVKAKKGMKNGSYTPKGHESLGKTIEVFVKDRIIVLPPTIHPDTNEPYLWLDAPLYEIDLNQLPVIGN